VRAAVDLVLDGGELPGTPSTVVDLTRFHEDGSFELVREGAVGREALTPVLRSIR
jgi:L-threonylcarbamoyladenylate synthase